MANLERPARKTGALAFSCRLGDEDAEILDVLQRFLRLPSRIDTVRFAVREAARARNLLVRVAAPRSEIVPRMPGGYR